MHHGGSFKTYLAHKNLKLQEQFEAQALAAAPASNLFAGVCACVCACVCVCLCVCARVLASNVCCSPAGAVPVG
jgi:hypothetical protein